MILSSVLCMMPAKWRHFSSVISYSICWFFYLKGVLFLLQHLFWYLYVSICISLFISVCFEVLYFIHSLNCILFLSLVALSRWSLHPSYIPPLSFEHYSVFSHLKMFQVILYLYCPDLEAIVSSRSTGSFL